MPDFFDSAGNKVEAVSAEELKTLEAQKNEELTKAREELKSREDELLKLKEKDLNFSNLRSQKEEAEKRVEALKAEIDVKVDKAKKEILDGVLKDHYNEALGSLAGGDEELKKKIEHHFNRFNDPGSSKSDIDKKLRDAWALSQDKPSMSSNAFATSNSVSMLRPTATSKTFSDEEKAFAKKFAAAGGIKLEDADFSKF